jgi:hypothetical protein
MRGDRHAPGASPIVGDESASHKLLYRPPDLREIEEFAWPHHAYRLILLPIEVSWSGVHRDDELRACRQGAFEEAIVRLVPDDAQFGQRIADEKAINDLNDEFRMIAQYIRVLLEDRRTDSRLNQVGVCEFKNQRGRVVLGWERGELQNARVKNDSQGMAWRVAVRARVAWLRRTQPPRLRSSLCRGFGGVPSPTPGRA